MGGLISKDSPFQEGHNFMMTTNDIVIIRNSLVNLIRAISLFIIMPVYFIANFPPKPCEVYDQVCFEKRDKAPYDLTMSLDSFIFELLYAVVVYVELLNFRMRSDVMRIDMKMKKEAREEIETSAESMQRF
ncbi:Protein CBG27755 [Caenorhabditis briggsae]|uniref:Protein CBG27755 n=1 Tax=Caenorhabditis briggsae TaxID=6238 RepID=B6IFX9_CAEBR|nr:Protein CBG27755 [Caenorhabditis briggsae]CAR98809.1 Protein CBG27755 [Caenorhabditis briggsae]